MGPYAGVDYITSPYVDSRVDSNITTMGNPLPESTVSPSQELRICPLSLALPPPPPQWREEVYAGGLEVSLARIHFSRKL
jgi:hypothetical protein